jgi:hypothetical protein
MYRVGFGDCFLLTLPTAAGNRQVVIDCGVHSRGDIGTLADAFGNLEHESQGKVALIVASHMHQDHIAGFDRFRPRFSALRPDEVWLPWTEDPQDQLASTLRTRQLAIGEQLAQHFAAAPAAPAAARDAVTNLVGNANAIDALKSGFGVGAQVRYLKAGDTLSNPAHIDGLSVQVLGPPHDQAFLSLMDPPAGQRFLRLGADGPEAANVVIPFAQKWRRDVDAQDVMEIRLSDAQRKEVRDNVAGMSVDALAFALDQVMNNTSLVLCFTIGGRSLLFAGDAQYGNWRWWLDNEDSKAILARIAFLKVAHHGSVNATPRDAVERLGDQVAAMISTQNVPWDSIPRLPLVEQLESATHNHLVRSDSLSLAAHTDAPTGPALATLPPGFSAGDLWYDYTIPL